MCATPVQVSLFPFDLLYQWVVTAVNNYVAINLLPLGNILLMIVSKWMQCLWHDLPDSLLLRLNITHLLFICTLGPELTFGLLGAISVLLTQKENKIQDDAFILTVLVNVM